MSTRARRLAFETKSRLFQDLSQHVLYVDRSVMVLNKPPGFETQPSVTKRVYDDRGYKEFRMLLELLRSTYKTTTVPQPVHRLDKPTTGCLLLGCTGPATRELYRQFQSRSVSKTYLALVRGGAESFKKLAESRRYMKRDGRGDRKSQTTLSPDESTKQLEFGGTDNQSDNTSIEWSISPSRDTNVDPAPGGTIPESAPRVSSTELTSRPSGEIRNRLVSHDGRMSVARGIKDIKIASAAETDWEVLGSSTKAPVSLMKLTLHSGLKHQLRVHMAECLHAPILGDKLHSSSTPHPKIVSAMECLGIADDRMFLHASHVSFFVRPSFTISQSFSRFFLSRYSH
ncbi:hypothetical protein JAAARDRAFT_73107 [Jaapia argillacea MUCL 33604]|uniref:Pseudouridine synthase RsuA/RluA-like domain-containing protein n=1 Tax=Jaapia argillacea MUCL 33604 TaxID=933084 RepID=A0A067PC65_9AGAM|nr:hypothetical protein JAAARDRAFT_73107 [Jaapia argillacea MUCL 33604]